MAFQRKNLFWILPAALFAALLVYMMADIALARARALKLVQAALDSSQVWITVDSLSQEQLDILIRVEDPTFFHHQGIDLKTPGAGLTTITQSIGKWLYFSPFKPGIRKFRLMWLSRYVTHPLVPKEDQLTLFLNYGYFSKVDSKVIWGLGQAAVAYYGVPVPELTRHQYISLIGMYPFPNHLNPMTHPEENAERVRRIEAYLAGEIQPTGLLDIYYDGSTVVAPRGPKK